MYTTPVFPIINRIARTETTPKGINAAEVGVTANKVSAFTKTLFGTTAGLAVTVGCIAAAGLAVAYPVIPVILLIVTSLALCIGISVAVRGYLQNKKTSVTNGIDPRMVLSVQEACSRAGFHLNKEDASDCIKLLNNTKKSRIKLRNHTISGGNGRIYLALSKWKDRRKGRSNRQELGHGAFNKTFEGLEIKIENGAIHVEKMIHRKSKKTGNSSNHDGITHQYKKGFARNEIILSEILSSCPEAILPDEAHVYTVTKDGKPVIRSESFSRKFDSDVLKYMEAPDKPSLTVEERIQCADTQLKVIHFMRNLNEPLAHLDIKLENMVIKEESGKKQFGVIDFDMAAPLNTTWEIEGTEIMLPPECLVFRHHKAIISQLDYEPTFTRGQVDPWALGMLLCELTMGCEKTDELRKDINITLKNWCYTNPNAYPDLSLTTNCIDELQRKINIFLQRSSTRQTLRKYNSCAPDLLKILKGLLQADPTKRVLPDHIGIA